LIPCEAIFPTSKDPKTRKIDARLLQYGDTFKVAPHSQIVTDGIILYGGSEVDESMITGESVPVAKGVHSRVFAGTTNGGGTLIVRLTTLPHENSVHKIATMVEDAELTKPRTQALADKIAGWFVPVMAAAGLIVFIVWLLVGHLKTALSWKNAAIQAITYAIATLIVSCPCAIGLAVPMVVLIAGGVAARLGIIIRDPTMLETARNVTDVVFDKTGTLTCGTPTVIGVSYFGDHAGQVRGILLSLLQDVKHPVATGVLRYLEDEADANGDMIAEPEALTGSIFKSKIPSILSSALQSTTSTVQPSAWLTAHATPRNSSSTNSTTEASRHT
jgi:P-type E1-E2 ATPase